MSSRLLRRLRRRATRVAPRWRIVLYDGTGLCHQVEVVRRYRPTRKARALICQACTHVEIEQVCE